MSETIPTDSSEKPNPLMTWGGYGLALLGSFLFATKGIYIKLAYVYDVDATTLLALRLLMATPFFLLVGLITWWKHRATIDIPRQTYVQAIAVGVLGYWFASYTDFEGLVHLTPQFERLILFTYPLFVILLGALFFGHKIKPWALSAFAISYAGLGLVFITDMHTKGGNITAGALWVTASSVAFALYLLLAKPVIKKMGPSLFTSWAMTGAAIASFIHFGVTHKVSDIALSAPLLWLCLGLAIGATVLPSYLINFALSRISSQANAVIGFINPVITLILSGLILREVITASDIAGTALVLLGVGLYSWLDQRKPHASIG
ncbi:DMT family transporter [Asticcacaulis sp. SL142]|uniref:DMT family transporter n=1 Tax=Asticcacaulis sp. SL142 TaxID=2995155 RepID=UPI00226CC039|nr:DMT family transporter [Asticcacaulis sp. SL142]WAC48780.1 DMT family transporter [Asticcacaulis sp. SL142]